MSTFSSNLDTALGTTRGPDQDIKQRIEDLEKEAASLRGTLSPADANGKKKQQRRRSDSNQSGDNNGDSNYERPRGRVKWVSQEDDAKSVSRLIVGAAMPDAVVGFPVNLHSKYDLNTNTALKGVAVAVLRINEDFGDSHAGICCLPSFRDNRNELTLTVHSLDITPIMPEEDDGSTQVLSVARSTEYSVLAGAVAKNSRDGKMSILKAIGASAVFCGVRALATAREYLASDGDEDIMVIPRFSKTVLDGRDSETTVTELCVLPNRGEEDADDIMGDDINDN